jgi:hypothetical protein
MGDQRLLHCPSAHAIHQTNCHCSAIQVFVDTRPALESLSRSARCRLGSCEMSGNVSAPFAPLHQRPRAPECRRIDRCCVQLTKKPLDRSEMSCRTYGAVRVRSRRVPLGTTWLNAANRMAAKPDHTAKSGQRRSAASPLQHECASACPSTHALGNARRGRLRCRRREGFVSSPAPWRLAWRADRRRSVGSALRRATQTPLSRFTVPTSGMPVACAALESDFDRRSGS